MYEGALGGYEGGETLCFFIASVYLRGEMSLGGGLG